VTARCDDFYVEQIHWLVDRPICFCVYLRRALRGASVYKRVDCKHYGENQADKEIFLNFHFFYLPLVARLLIKNGGQPINALELSPQK